MKINKVIVPCLFADTTKGNLITQIDFMISLSNRKVSHVGDDLIEPISDQDTAGLFFKIVRLLLRQGYNEAIKLQFCLTRSCKLDCKSRHISFTGDSMTLPLLLGSYLLINGLSWPCDTYASGGVFFGSRRIIGISAYTQKARYAIQEKQGRILLPKVNARSLRRSAKWNTSKLIALPDRTEEAYKIITDLSRGTQDVGSTDF